MLTIKDLHAGYGSSEVLHGATLTVPQGRLVAVIGPNGAGKTTTMRAISGLIRPRSGQVLFGGEDIAGMEAARVARLGLAHVPEGRHVFGPLAVEENLLLGAYGRLPKLFGYMAGARAGLERVYAMFPRLKERRRQLAGTLSGGEQQMLAVGRALMAEPQLILLDEPSMGLAPVIVEELFATLNQLKQQGITMLLVEQMAHKALQVADHVYVMERGRVVIDGPPDQLRQDARVVAAYLGS
jgi:branched-chain amino acid transport system ATP-binding protein